MQHRLRPFGIRDQLRFCASRKRQETRYANERRGTETDFRRAEEEMGQAESRAEEEMRNAWPPGFLTHADDNWDRSEAAVGLVWCD